MFKLIIQEVNNRFNLGDKALPLVQMLAAAMTNEEYGGLAGFTELFNKKGLENLLDSWMNSAAPLSINHVQIEEVLGGKGGLLEAIIAKTGLDKGTALLSLAYLLPRLFNQLVPGGAAISTFSPETASFIEKGLALLNAGGTSPAGSAARGALKPKVENIGTFERITHDVDSRFNLGDKALPLVQVLTAAMTHKETGGLAGFIERFKNNGLENLLDSWMNSAALLSINHVQIEEVLGGKGGLLEAITAKAGLDKGTALLSLAYLLPRLFNQLAPGGVLNPALEPELTRFAEKGTALLGAGFGATGAPAVAHTPAEAVNPVPVTRKYTPKPEGASDKITAVSGAKAGGGLLRFLLWFILIAALGSILMFKKSSKAPDQVPAISEETTLPAAADSVNVVDAGSPVPEPVAPSSEPAPEAEPAPTQAQAVSAPDQASVAAVNVPADTSSSESTPAGDAQTPEQAAVSPSAKIYFAFGKATLPADADATLAPIIEYLHANKDAKVMLSGFHDAKGSKMRNQKLAKNRAQSVQEKLLSSGIAKNSIILEKPQLSAAGNGQEDRRVEVNIRN